MAADDKQNGKTKDCLHNTARFCCQQRILRYCAGVLFCVARCLVVIFIVIFCEIVWAQNHSNFNTDDSATKSVNVHNFYTQIESEIAEMERNSEILWNYSKTIANEVLIGNSGGGAYEKEYNRVLCYILGRFVGYGDFVVWLRPSYFNYKIDLTLRTVSYASDLQEISLFMGYYARIGRDVIAMSESARIDSWNLDCPGRHGIPKVYAEKRGGQSPFFKIDGNRLQVLGDIDDNFSTRLYEVLQRNPQIRIVSLGSGGGSVVEAMRAGWMIRSRGIHTELVNSCYSACPLVLLGGVERTMMSKSYEIGFHQVHSNGRAIPLDSYTYSAIYEYANMMGVDGAFVVKSMWSAPPESMKVFTGSDDVICEAGVMTWIKLGCYR